MILTQEQIDQARVIAIKAMQDYSSERAISAAPGYNPATNIRDLVRNERLTQQIKESFPTYQIFINSDQFKNLLEQYFQEAEPVEEAVTIYIAGGFGAGKTTLEEKLKNYQGTNPYFNSLSDYMSRAKSLSFKDDILAYLEPCGYDPDKHQESFWKIRPLMAGCHAAINF